MAKAYINTVKYQILIDFEVQGIVDKHDIIGAIFGQSEGLIGEEMDLRELQKSGKLGRIEVNAETHSGKTGGEIIVPSSMDTVKTALLAASIESVDKVGPCDSSFKIKKIEDSRKEKRSAVQERAKELLKQLSTVMPETDEMTEAVRTGVRKGALKEFGEEKLPCGPDLEKSKEIVIVEGRADVLNLLKHGIKNAVAIDGARIPESIIELSKTKSVTAFVDGDRGGDLIARKLIDVANIVAIAKAPDGKEVEELTGKEIITSLKKTTASEDFGRRTFSRGRPRESAPTRRCSGRSFDGPSTRGPPRGRSQAGSGYTRGPPSGRSTYGRGPPRGRDSGRSFDRGPPRVRERSFREPPKVELKQDLGKFGPVIKELESSLKARLLGKGMKQVKEVSVRDLLKAMETEKKVESVVFDGIVTKRLLAQAEKSGIKTIVGMKKGKIEESKKVKVLTAV
ncbi:MAG: DNA primase DnaG [archaeon]|jgi:5S rRNA maturation endonuclease (ribonuclease M5)/phage FluMu protein gp41|nr:DNA primase DnaG [archaeon]